MYMLTNLKDEKRCSNSFNEQLPELRDGHVGRVVAVEAGLVNHLLLLAPPFPLRETGRKGWLVGSYAGIEHKDIKSETYQTFQLPHLENIEIL